MEDSEQKGPLAGFQQLMNEALVMRAATVLANAQAEYLKTLLASGMDKETAVRLTENTTHKLVDSVDLTMRAIGDSAPKIAQAVAILSKTNFGPAK